MLTTTTIVLFGLLVIGIWSFLLFTIQAIHFIKAGSPFLAIISSIFISASFLLILYISLVSISFFNWFAPMFIVY